MVNFKCFLYPCSNIVYLKFHLSNILQTSEHHYANTFTADEMLQFLSDFFLFFNVRTLKCNSG